MSIIHTLLDLFLHIDVHLASFMSQYGAIVYIFLFLIIFCETGLVITPFLPGDSLIFTAGALSAIGVMSWWSLPMFIVAAIVGNMLNYRIGKFLSDRVKRREKIRFIKREYIDEAERFLIKYGGMTIVITRFMPILRTFVPFIAGVGNMKYKRFTLFNIIGGTSWVIFFFIIGNVFGNVPTVKAHFSLIVIGIVFISIIPAIIVFIKTRLKTNRN